MSIRPIAVEVEDVNWRHRRVLGHVTEIRTGNLSDGSSSMAGLIDYRLDDGSHVKERGAEFIDLDGNVYLRRS